MIGSVRPLPSFLILACSTVFAIGTPRLLQLGVCLLAVAMMAVVWLVMAVIIMVEGRSCLWS
jgi:hypothetical protein